MLLWPYSAFTWGDLPTQRRMIAKCDTNVSALVTFARDSWITVDGVRSFIFDYSIRQLGPSPRFRRLRADGRNSGRAVMAKTETAVSIEMFNVPRIPVMHRWAERFDRIRRAGVDGVHTTWRFAGFGATLNEELVNYFAWEPAPDADAFLAALAGREFGKEAAGAAVSAWKRFSEAFGHFPYSAGLSGMPYFRGPFFIGPAHPFVFDPHSCPAMPECFFRIDPSMRELSDDPEFLRRHRLPLFFADLSWTQPFGPATVARSLRDMHRLWRKGVEAIAAAAPTIGEPQRRRLEEELRLAQCIDCMLVTARNLLRFQQLRLAVTTEASTPAKIDRCAGQLQQVLADEIRNAETALELVKADPALGFGGTYGNAFTAEMIQAKLDHAIEQKDRVLGEFFHSYRFHFFGTM